MDTNRIVLINPPTSHLKSDTGIVSKGLLSIHSFLKKNDIDSIFIDLSGTKKELWTMIPDSDIYGITAVSCQIDYVEKLIKFLKFRNEKCDIIIGGPHAIALPEDCLLKRGADLVCLGEGEKALLNYLKSGCDLKSKGFAFKERDWSIIYNNPIEIDHNIEQFYPLRYQDIGIYRYLNPEVFQYANKTVDDIQLTITFSRGCYGTCKFCMSGNKKGKVRYRNIDNMINEIKYYKDRWGITRIYFDDDELLTDKKHLFDLCNGMKKTKLDWMCLGRADMASKEKFAKMKDCGCIGIIFGIESFSNRVLTGLAKRITARQNYNTLILASVGFGFKVRAQMIIGSLPYETDATIKETAEYIKLINTITGNKVKFSFHLFQPLPGTVSYNDALKDPIHWDHKILTKFNSFQTVGDFKYNKKKRPLIAHKNRTQVYKWYDYLNKIAGESELLT